MRLSLIVILIVILLSCFNPIVCSADVYDEIDDSIDEAIDSLDLSDVEDIVPEGLFDNIVDKMRDIINGDIDSADSYWQYILGIIDSNISSILPTMITLFAVAVLISLVSKGDGFLSKSTSNVTYFVGFVVLMSTLVVQISGLLADVYSLLDSISQLLDVALPILLTLMIANSAVVTAKVYQPAVVLLSSGIIKIISTVVLPLCSVGMVFGICSNISDNVKVDKVSNTVNSMASWILGIMFMLFFSFMTVQGITAMSIDGVSIRAAKFATKNYIPLLGGYLSDGFDLIMASTTLIKNSFGLVMLIIVFGYTMVPLINILLCKFGLMLVASIGQPIMDSRFVNLLNSIGKSLTMVAIVVVAVIFMCLLVIMLAILSANGV